MGVLMCSLGRTEPQPSRYSLSKIWLPTHHNSKKWQTCGLGSQCLPDSQLLCILSGIEGTAGLFSHSISSLSGLSGRSAVARPGTGFGKLLVAGVFERSSVQLSDAPSLELEVLISRSCSGGRLTRFLRQRFHLTKH